MKSLIVRRSNSMGDVIEASCVVAALVEDGYAVEFQTDPYWHPMLRRNPRLASVKLSTLNGQCDINLDGAYECHPERTTKSMVELYVERVPFKCVTQPALLVPNKLRQKELRDSLASHPRPWIMICPKAMSFANRTIPDSMWQAVAAQTPGTKFWLGQHPAPEGIVDLRCNVVEDLVDYISLCDLFVTVETGPMHIGGALGVPMVVIKQAVDPKLTLSNHKYQCSVVSAALNCLNCQQPACPIDPQHPPCQDVSPVAIAAEVNRRLTTLGPLEGETQKYSHLTKRYCYRPDGHPGCGVDIGTQGDPIVPWAMQFDLPDDQYKEYADEHPPKHAIQLKGVLSPTPNSLPFSDNSLDFVHCSHVLEDFEPEHRSAVIKEMGRVLKPGGNLILLVPDRALWHQAIANGQLPNPYHKREPEFGEMSRDAVAAGLIVVKEELTAIYEGDFTILGVFRKP